MFEAFYDELTAEGETEEQAIENLLGLISGRIGVSKVLKNGTKLETWILEQLPKEGVPSTHGLLLLQTICHSSGSSGYPRVFAVKRGEHGIYCDFRGPREKEEDQAWTERQGVPKPIRFGQAKKVLIGDEPALYSFCDSNSQYEYPLPEGSLEFVDGSWVATTAAKYDY